MPSDNGGSVAAVETAAAVGAALVAAYVRAKGEPRPWHWRAILARCAEAVVCGFLAVGAASAMEWTDARATIGLSAALGLIGTQAISDLLMRLAAKKVGP